MFIVAIINSVTKFILFISIEVTHYKEKKKKKEAKERLTQSFLNTTFRKSHYGDGLFKSEKGRISTSYFFNKENPFPKPNQV